MLLVPLCRCATCLFFRSQPKLEVIPTVREIAIRGGCQRPARYGSRHAVHSQYKEAMDRAHAAAKSMQDERKEADSY